VGNGDGGGGGSRQRGGQEEDSAHIVQSSKIKLIVGI
jgi:hypothetical protein